MIEIKNVTKQFGLNPVLRGVNLQINVGEFITLVGSNGAGKSTLLRIVATLAKPTSGTVTIGGYPLHSHAHQVREHIGLVSHQSLLYGDLSAAQNLDFFARLYQLSNRVQLINDALARVGLLARQRDPVSTFSRGMMQRLTLARATLHQPDVLLLDEPYTGLDQDATILLDQLLQQEHQCGRTILLITHNLTRGLDLCDRIVILNQGKIVQEVDRTTMTTDQFIPLYHQVTQKRYRQ